MGPSVPRGAGRPRSRSSRAGRVEPARATVGSDEEDAEFRVDGVPLADVLAGYDAACARSDAAIAGHDLDAPGSTALHPVGDASLRWMLLHMLEETARHAGHLDLVREHLDGETGYY